MKKTVILASLTILVTSSVAFGAPATIASGAVSAEAGAVIRGGATEAAADVAAIMGKMSTGVKLGAAYDTGGFAVWTKHKNGSKIFGTAHDSTAIYWKNGSAGTDMVEGDISSTIGNTAFATDYTAM